jgi:hypothetical protein
MSPVRISHIELRPARARALLASGSVSAPIVRAGEE